MLSKRQKNIADQLVRATAVERLSQIGAPLKAGARPTINYLAKLVNRHAGLDFTHDPMDMIRSFASERPSGAVPGREINAMRQPPMEYPPAFIVAAQRAREAQPPMMSMCGRLEGWDG